MVRSSPQRRRALPREFVEAHQRQRVVVAIAELAHEHGGSGALTAAQIIARARMSRNTFYELFGSKDNGVRFAFQASYEFLFEPVRVAGEGSEPWLGRLCGALDALLAGAVAEPLLAELCLIHSLAALTDGEGCAYQTAVVTMSELIGGGRGAAREELGGTHPTPPSEVEEFLARAIVSLVALRIRQGAVEELPGHRDELVRLVATPFFGNDEAARMSRNLKLCPG
jgi:AcrR family transcriptional regulator